MPEHMTCDQLVEEFLAELSRALESVDPGLRRELVTSIEEHIAEGRRNLDPNDEEAIRNLLDRIGSPHQLAAELTEEEPDAHSAIDRATPWFVLFGGLALGLGWLVGLYGLWTSRTWRQWDRLLGTLVWPGGIAAVVLFMGLLSGGEYCRSSGGNAGSPPTSVCIKHGVSQLASPWPLVVTLLVIVAPLLVFMRLTSVLSRGYANAANPRGFRLKKGPGSKSFDAKPLWIVAIIPVVALLWLLVA